MKRAMSLEHRRSFGKVERTRTISGDFACRKYDGGTLHRGMGLEDDLRRVEEHIAEARRLVQRQKGLIIRLQAAGMNTLDAQRILWLLESNLRRLEEHRDRMTGSEKI